MDTPLTFDYPIGRLLGGTTRDVETARRRFLAQPVDEVRLSPETPPGAARRTTLGGFARVTGPGTFVGKAQRTLTFGPSPDPGWWIDRSDQIDALPIQVSIRNVWTSVRNLVLRSGSPHNYLRMVEHIVALKLGMGLDDVRIQTDSGDPPLFDRGSLDLVEALEQAGTQTLDAPAVRITVKEPVTIGGYRGDFITLLPATPECPRLRMDCAIDFRSAIGQQRIVFDLTPETFRYGAQARTNATHAQMWMVKTIGRLFADTRNLGYTTNNILVHGRRRYINTPKLITHGRSLEAVWHRASLDLLAALALIDKGRFAGTVVSFRAGHELDVKLVTQLYAHDLLETFGCANA